MDKLSALLHSQRIIVVSAEYSSFKTVWEILLKPFSQRSNRIVFCVGLSLTWWVCWRPATTRIGSKKNKKVRHNFLAFSSPQLAANFHQKQRREKMMVVVWETRGEACQTRWRLGATQRREAGCLRRELTVCLDWETQLKRQDLKLTAGLALNYL